MKSKSIPVKLGVKPARVYRTYSHAVLRALKRLWSKPHLLRRLLPLPLLLPPPLSLLPPLLARLLLLLGAMLVPASASEQQDSTVQGTALATVHNQSAGFHMHWMGRVC